LEKENAAVLRTPKIARPLSIGGLNTKTRGTARGETTQQHEREKGA